MPLASPAATCSTFFIPGHQSGQNGELWMALYTSSSGASMRQIVSKRYSVTVSPSVLVEPLRDIADHYRLLSLSGSIVPGHDSGPPHTDRPGLGGAHVVVVAQRCLDDFLGDLGLLLGPGFRHEHDLAVGNRIPDQVRNPLLLVLGVA